MNNKTIVVIAVVTAFLTTLVFIPRLVNGMPSPLVMHETSYIDRPTINGGQIIWLSRLMQCESGIKGGAINPNDLDNTPSYGILQFKPSTFAAAAIKYHLASTTDYMNPASQVAVVVHWILDGSVDWHQQFPNCISKLGLPPL